MAEVTYYFNARGDAVWTDPDNIVDNNLETFGYTNAKKTAQVLTGNSCPATDLGTITKVELRLYAYGDGDDRIDITPVFTGGNGNAHQTTPVVSPGGWGVYVNITNDPNHPDWSLWSHIQDLDCIIDSVAVAKGNTLYCAKVEIRVTYWVPPVADIDVGAIPIDRSAREISGSTQIDKNNPANASGTLHSVKVYAYEDITGLRVGTFYTTNGNRLKCRDSVLIGDVPAGLQTLTELSITVQEGDYIGFYCSSGSIDSDTTGFAGRWRVAGEYIDPGDETDYSFFAGYAMSLYGYGDIGAPPVVTTQAVADIAATTATGHGTITATFENCTKRGVCWNTIGSPTVADDKSEETDSFGIGAFSRPMTGLSPATHYYVKAYAYNSEGYGYGSQVEFDTAWEPPVSDIDIGADPIDRPGAYAEGATRVDKNNPANASGTLHTVLIYPNENIEGLVVGTFYTTNGNTLKCRDSEALGNAAAGAMRTFSGLSLAVETGDYIGCYFTAGRIENNTSGFVGVWTAEGEYIDPNDEAAYAFSSGRAMSLYGYGDIVPPPDIDIGAEAWDRIGYAGSGFTRISKDNPANASGILRTIEIFAATIDIEGLIVGTFYLTNGATLKCRDSEAIPGTITAGEKVTKAVTIAVVAGDYIGCYYTAGNIKRDTSGFAGYWSLLGESIDPNDEAEYSYYTGYAQSLYGYGDIVAAPENTVYLVKATGRRTQLSVGAVAIRIDPTTGRRSLDTSLTKFLVREDDGTLRAKSA